jgi:hypothetical protein
MAKTPTNKRKNRKQLVVRALALFLAGLIGLGALASLINLL